MTPFSNHPMPGYRFKLIFSFSMLLVLFLVFLGIYHEEPLFMLLPFGFFIPAIWFLNPRWLLLVFFFLLPFSIELYLPGGLGTDLPSEPIMVIIAIGTILLWLINLKSIPAKYILNPLSLLIILHVAWILLTAIWSSDPLISFKFFLAKTWYVIPFYFLPLYLFRKHIFLKEIGLTLLPAILLAIAFVFYQHSAYDFSFKDVNRAVSPIFRNHVNYACLLAIFFPILWFLWTEYKARSIARFLLFVSFVSLVIALYLTYTRVAHISVFIAAASFVLIKYKLLRYAIAFGSLITIVGVFFFVSNDRYLEYNPDFEKTITHYRFDNLIEATTKGEDISTMERVYRWVAGYQMIKEKPISGFGPGTFYPNYHAYTIRSFKTYVSDNPDRSGIHNYYLMTFVEQGILGLLIFLSICFTALLRGEIIYHRLRDSNLKNILMASLLSLIIICAILLINDMLEADKVGPFFFLCLSIVSACEIWFLRNESRLKPSNLNK